jgi:hypothetical protein
MVSKAASWWIVAWVVVPSCLYSFGVGAADRSRSKASGGNDPNPMATLEASIKAMIARPICETDADCRVIGFGAKACGGPKSFLYYSVKTLQEATLKKKVEEYNLLERKRNQDAGVMSTCSIEEPLIPRCVAIGSKKLCQGTSP